MNISAIQGINFKAVQAPKLQQNNTVTSPIQKNENKTDVMAYMNNIGRQAMIKPNMQKSMSISFTGWSPEAHNKETIEQMVKVIKDPSVKRIAVSGHTSPDGDSFGTTFAMANLINQATGKKVDVFVFGDKFPSHYDYLNTNPDVNVIVHKPGKKDRAEACAQKYGKYDLATACDCSETKLMAQDYRKGVMNNARYSMKIDHHPYKEEYDPKTDKTYNNKYAKTANLIDSSMPAAEIAMQFVEPLGLKPEELRKETKDAMFTGILTDTGCFKFANTPMTFEDAALLMKAGVNNREVNLNAMGNTPQVVLDAEKTALSKIKYSNNHKIAYIIEDEGIKKAKKACTDAGYGQEGKDAVKDVCGRLPELEGVEIGFKVAEFGDKASFSIRSRSFDVSKIAQKYQGGGHKNAAAFQIAKNGRSTEKVVQDLINELNQAMEESKA